MEKIYLTEINGKMAYKKGLNGYCYTFNKNEKSKLKAYNDAKKSHTTYEQNRTT